MKNCLILGSGRSGTSMLAGTLYREGLYIGDRVMPPTPGNPKGYFESFDIQDLNEDILKQVEIQRGRIVVDEQRKTSLPWLFAGGDIANKTADAISAIADGFRAVAGIENYFEARKEQN